jgi:hypothetical protein
MRWTEHVARAGRKRNIYPILVGKSEAYRTFGRPRLRWDNNIKMNFKEKAMNVWTGFIWHRMEIVAGWCEHGDEPAGSAKGLKFSASWVAVGFPRSFLLHETVIVTIFISTSVCVHAQTAYSMDGACPFACQHPDLLIEFDEVRCG